MSSVTVAFLYIIIDYMVYKAMRYHGTDIFKWLNIHHLLGECYADIHSSKRAKDRDN